MPPVAIPNIDLSLMSIRHLYAEAGCLNVLSFSPFLPNHALMVASLRAYARAQHKPGTGYIQDIMAFLGWCSWLSTHRISRSRCMSHQKRASNVGVV